MIFLWTKACLLVDFSFGFTGLFFNSLKENFQSKWPVDIHFFMINRGYNTNDQLNFILKVIKRDYGMNDQSKLALNKEKDHR